MSGTPILVNVTGGLQDQCGFKKEDGSYFMLRDGYKYNYHDDKTELLCGILSEASVSEDSLKENILQILKNNSIFHRDLTTLPGLVDTVAAFAWQILKDGMPKVLNGLLIK